MSFTHLHLHTLYSLLDGAIRMKDLIKTVKAKGMSAVAVTDHGNMFGAIDFYKKAKDAGIKPILGLEAYVAGEQGPRRTGREKVANHLILLAKNEEGYANLRYLASQGLPRRLLLPPAHRQAAAQGAQRRALRAHRLPRRRGDLRLLPRATWTTPGSAAREYKDIFAPGPLLPRDPVQRAARAGEGQRQPQAARPRRGPPAGRHRRRPLHQARGRRGARAPDGHRLGQDAGRQQADEAHSTDQLYVTSPEEMLRLLHATCRRRCTTPCASPSSARSS